MVHDITGLDEANLGMARQLAQAGLWVAAIDLFGGRTAPDLEGGMKLRAGLTDAHRVDCARAGFEALRAAMGPGATVGILGFCMGGGAALQAACALPLAFCIDYYGRIDRAADVAGLAGPVLFIAASEDDWVNGWLWGELLPALDGARKRVSVELYPGVRHAFHREGWPAFDAAAAQDAMTKAVAFALSAADAS